MSLRSSQTSASSTSSPNEPKTALSLDGRTGGRRRFPSLRSLRDTDVLRSSTNSTPPVVLRGEEGGAMARRMSEGHLLKRGEDDSKDPPRDALSKSDRRGERPSRRSKKPRSNQSNSIKFRRVDVDWTPGQLEDRGAAGVAVDTGRGSHEDMDNSVVESLQMEIMDLRPSTHPSIIDSSFVSILDEEMYREMFHVQLGASDRDEMDLPASHWEHVASSEAQLHRSIMRPAASRRGSWNSHAGSIAPGANDDFNSVSGSIVSTMSESVRSQTAGSDSRSGSKDGEGRSDALGGWRKGAHYKKYVRPMVLVVGLAALTAGLIYVFIEGMFEEELEGWTIESRSVVRNWLGEAVEEGGVPGEVGGRVLEDVVGSVEGVSVPVTGSVEAQDVEGEQQSCCSKR